MTTPNTDLPWNAEAKIACEFSFKCPKVWDRLQPTAVEGIHHCSECDRDVHLALTEEDFRRYANEGQCVAVRVLQSERSLDENDRYVFGNAHAPYNARRRPL